MCLCVLALIVPQSMGTFLLLLLGEGCLVLTLL